MTYKGRVPILGLHESRPFAGFILASRSEPDRVLEVDEKNSRVWVAPGQRLKEDIAKSPYMAVENLYPCLIGFYDCINNPVAVSFNGRMSNRVEAMMKTGETAGSALRQILPVFPPLPNDPRIGAVVSLHRYGRHSFHFAVYDRTGKPYMAVNEVEVEPDSAVYVTLTDCRNMGKVGLKGVSNLDELPAYLFAEILGKPPEFGCGSAVCMIDTNGFKFGVYNRQQK